MIIGIVFGFLIATSLPYLQPAFAQTDPKEALSPEEVDKKLSEVLESQKELKKRIDNILTQTGFLKASSGK